MDLQQFVASTLSRHGCVTQTAAADVVHALLSPAVAATLELSEETQLVLRDAGSNAQSVQAAYGSALLGRICALNDSLGRLYRVELVPPRPKLDRVEREAASVLAFRNGIARLESIETEVLRYIVGDFKYTALSEDRHEGVVSVALDVDGGSSPSLATRLARFLSEHPETRRPWSDDRDRFDVALLNVRLRRSALAAARSESHPFVNRMTRRLRRDSQRVAEYYETLLREVEQRRERASDPATRQRKIEAIVAESRRRREDLERRYAVQLRLEPLVLLWVRIEGLRLRIRIQRRKHEAAVTLGWNGVAREVDRWTCDACGSDAQVPALCDALHRLCPDCAPACGVCGPNAGKPPRRAPGPPRPSALG